MTRILLLTVAVLLATAASAQNAPTIVQNQNLRILGRHRPGDNLERLQRPIMARVCLDERRQGARSDSPNVILPATCDGQKMKITHAGIMEGVRNRNVVELILRRTEGVMAALDTDTRLIEFPNPTAAHKFLNQLRAGEIEMVNGVWAHDGILKRFVNPRTSCRFTRFNICTSVSQISVDRREMHRVDVATRRSPPDFGGIIVRDRRPARGGTSSN